MRKLQLVLYDPSPDSLQHAQPACCNVDSCQADTFLAVIMSAVNIEGVREGGEGGWRRYGSRSTVAVHVVKKFAYT
jgi:hypothetical protein